MKRELKFRIWDDRENKKSFLPKNYLNFDILNLDKVSDYFIVTQFTGLFDKNGKEIYEGDIVKGNNLFNFDGDFCGDIRYIPCRYQCFVKYPNGGYGGVILDDYEVQEHNLQIIGNIFENPELLD